MPAVLHLSEELEQEILQITEDVYKTSVKLGQEVLLRPSGSILYPEDGPTRYTTGIAGVLMNNMPHAYGIRSAYDQTFSEQEFSFLTGLLWGYSEDQDLVLSVISTKGDISEEIGLSVEIIRQCASRVSELTAKEAGGTEFGSQASTQASVCWVAGCYVGRHFYEVEALYAEES